MRKLFVSLAAVVCAVPLLASNACSSGGKSCTDKACPNDPPPSQQAIDACNSSKTKSNKCSSQCSTYSSCIESHTSDICGADGKTDPNKALTLVTVTCKASSECTTCLSMP